MNNVTAWEGEGLQDPELFGGTSLAAFILLDSTRPGRQLSSCAADSACGLMISKTFWHGSGLCNLVLSCVVPRDCLRTNAPGTSPCSQYECCSTGFGCLCGATRTLLASAFPKKAVCPSSAHWGCATQTSVSCCENTTVGCHSALALFSAAFNFRG